MTMRTKRVMPVRQTVDMRTIGESAAFGCFVLYLVLIPSGLLGLFLVLLATLCRLLAIRNATTIGVYMLLFGMMTVGRLTIVAGIAGIGGKCALAIGLALLLSRTPAVELLRAVARPASLILWILCVMCVFYLMGPQTSYSRLKLSDMAVTGLLTVVAFHYLLTDPQQDWAALGQLGILSALVVLAAVATIMPGVLPSNMFQFGQERALVNELRIEEGLARNNIGYLACLGAVLLYAARPDKKCPTGVLARDLVYLFGAALILLWGGARLPIVSIGLVCMLVPLAKPLCARRFVSVSVILLGVLSMGVYHVRDADFVASVFDTSASWARRVNRDYNWSAAIDCFAERPLCGHGLGGYYVEGITSPGDGTYAHNLFLELLSETGVIGTILVVIAPVVCARRYLRRINLRQRASSGGIPAALLAVIFLQSMVSFDLTKSIVVFSLTGVLAARANARRAGPIVPGGIDICQVHHPR